MTTNLILKKLFIKTKIFCNSSLKVGVYLAFKQIVRGSKGKTLLLIFIMFLTMLNLFVVSGVLIGLVANSSKALRTHYSGDVFISALEDETEIKQSTSIINLIDNISETQAYTPRVVSSGRIEANYKIKKKNKKPDEVIATIAGIDPELENKTTDLETFIVEGSYLIKDDINSILIGSGLLDQYTRGIPGDESLEDVFVGSKVRVIIGDSIKDFEVKGILDSKITEVGNRVFVNEKILRSLISRPNLNVDEIAISLVDKNNIELIKNSLKNFNTSAKIESWEEAQGQFFKDLSTTFVLLSNFIGLISIVVASITIFIVIYINAINRRKYIGIQKGIGICSSSITISYLIQSLFYTFIGVFFALILFFALIKPYFDKNPIDFPFSDGTIVTTLFETILRIIIIFIVAAAAGYIPAKIIINKNTLDSILGRN